MDMKYDLVVIGSGPGGYVAAIRAAQLGMRTALVEKYDTLGGTCLNVGCIPSKALLDSSEHYHNAHKKFSDHGIEIDQLRVDMSKMIERKNKVVSQTCDGIKYLMKKNKIDTYFGTASFVDETSIKVSEGDKSQVVSSQKFVIATGSKPTNLPFIEIDKERIITSTEALSLREIPKKMCIIGGGVIGLELGSVYARLGTEVSVVEYADRIISTMDATMSKELQKSLRKLGMKLHVGHKVTGATRSGNKVNVSAQDAQGKELSVEADYCLVCVGRSPYTVGLGLENTQVKCDEKGFVEVDENLKTQAENIYAIGDVIGGAMLAHKASEEGVLVVEKMLGQKPHMNYNLIPAVVYTWPEVASVGKTEAQLVAENIPYKTGNFPMKALGRSRASADTEGLVKMLAHKETDEILGVHIIGARAADLISEAVVAMEYRASAEDIARISHAHPTYSEAMKEAALDATEKRPLHI